MSDTGSPIEVTGPVLRALRLASGRTLREVARAAKLSHGHLSKIETGDRPDSYRVVAAYGAVLGIDIEARAKDGTLLAAAEPGLPSRQMTKAERLELRTQVAGVVAGGSVRVATTRGPAGRPQMPQQWDEIQLAALEQVADLLETLGEPAAPLAHALVDSLWLVRDRRAAVAAARVARCAAHRFVHEAPAASRGLLLWALEHAVRADRPDLTASVLCDIADGLTASGFGQDALVVLRLAAGDDRVSAKVAQRVKECRARAEGDRR